MIKIWDIVLDGQLVDHEYVADHLTPEQIKESLMKEKKYHPDVCVVELFDDTPWDIIYEGKVVDTRRFDAKMSATEIHELISKEYESPITIRRWHEGKND